MLRLVYAINGLMKVRALKVRGAAEKSLQEHPQKLINQNNENRKIPIVELTLCKTPGTFFWSQSLQKRWRP